MSLVNKDLAYLIGSYQSDGYFYTFNDKKRNKISKRLGISGCKKSLPMLIRFRDTLRKNFDRNVKIENIKNRNIFVVRASVNRLIKTFESIELLSKQFSAQDWILKNNELFGSFLAGLIDGDGSVVVKRPRYPQCCIRIWDGTPPFKLKVQIERKMNCTARIYFVKSDAILRGKRIQGQGYYLEFYISRKNIDFMKKFVMPEIQIFHKKRPLEEFVKLREN